MNKRPKRAAAARTEGGFREREEDEVWRDYGGGTWQEDWRSEAPDPSERKEEPGRKRKHTTAPTQAPSTQQQTQEEVRAEIETWIRENRNQNTEAAYASAWRQFERWASEVANPQRAAAAHVDLQRPSEADVAAYVRHIVMVKRSTMQSVGTATAGIADRLRYTDHHPCSGELVQQMKATLKPLAKPAGQKKEMSWTLLRRTVERAAAEGTQEGRRDATMLLLAYFGYLRGSEAARMERRDITIGPGEGTTNRVMRVHVNRLAKNDKERKGHERLVQERARGEMCPVRAMEAYMAEGAGKEEGEPLFPTVNGTKMHADTPRGRLKHWLQQGGVKNASEYGFHSLRAGAATASAKAGVPERHIKLHGNWKSDAVRAYIRPDEAERLRASSALGNE
jgi:integrase